MSVARVHVVTLVACFLSVACGSETDPPLIRSQAVANAFANSEWSAPVNIGAPVNSPAGESNAAFSPDELAIYFTSNRPGTLGPTDIWVSERACLDCPWQPPVNLAAVNTPFSEAGPRLSIDGHLLFFQSDKPGGQGSFDIYVSRRSNKNDNFSWGEPKALGTGVNTPAVEQAAVYLQSAEDGQGNLYFNRGPGLAQGDIYYAAVTRDGETRGDAVFVMRSPNPAVLMVAAILCLAGLPERLTCQPAFRGSALAGVSIVEAHVRLVWSPDSTTNLGVPRHASAFRR